MQYFDKSGDDVSKDLRMCMGLMLYSVWAAEIIGYRLAETMDAFKQKHTLVQEKKQALNKARKMLLDVQRNLELAEIYYKGARRTGCVGCGFGCFVKEDQRFDLLYRLYPKYYEMIMNYKNNGVTFREALRKVLAVTGKELPDESGRLFFEYEDRTDRC